MLLPKAFPDELFFSRIIRFATISGLKGKEFNKIYLAEERASIHPFLTSNLKKLSALTDDEPYEILFGQTLAPIYIFYLPKHSNNIIKFMLSNDSARSIRESQLPSFGAGSSLCLKWCQECACSDINQYGVAYWHRSHQIPGVSSCGIHPVLLERIDLHNRQRISLGMLPSVTCRAKEASSVEYKVGKFGYDLLRKIKWPIPLIDISSRYRYKLQSMGLVTNSGRIRRLKLMQNFYVFSQNYRPFHNSSLPKSSEDFRYISQLLVPGENHNPFQHIFFSSWLFSTFQQLLEDHNSVEFEFKTRKKEFAKRTKRRERKCVELLRSRSLNETSKITGRSRTYLKRLAALHNIPLNLKPRKISKACIDEIIRLGYTRMNRHRIATICKIGVGSVEQIISTHPELVTYRKRCHMESMRRRYRLKILKYYKLHPKAIRKDIKFHCNKAFYWLYLYDREWLEVALPKPLKAKGRYPKK
ncbi:TnsD family Tn7-like transposition protein [Microbulbifer sp. CnH-101-G]|uniref:TnsD family Tn7-like transposition protein n=1 Tax=Microbulbifer sp. CnH-101-G TaxID=3243393 RepID=UPI0040397F32